MRETQSVQLWVILFCTTPGFALFSHSSFSLASDVWHGVTVSMLCVLYYRSQALANTGLCIVPLIVPFLIIFISICFCIGWSADLRGQSSNISALQRGAKGSKNCFGNIIFDTLYPSLHRTRCNELNPLLCVVKTISKMLEIFESRQQRLIFHHPVNQNIKAQNV